MSNLVNHARRELGIIGEEPEIVEMYINVVKAFVDFGHSGGSASVAIPVINELLQFKNLSPLTDDPGEWVHHGNNTWQSCRNSEAFSDDGGKTYYLLSDRDKREDPEGSISTYVSEKKRSSHEA